jgi:hypothetical protein
MCDFNVVGDKRLIYTFKRAEVWEFRQESVQFVVKVAVFQICNILIN